MKTFFPSRAGLISVKARLYGPAGDAAVLLALDTGATTTTIAWECAVVIGIDPASSPARIGIRTATGILYAPVLKLDRVDALDQSVADFEVVCHDLPPGSYIHGVLGLDFLRRFDLRINFKEGYITLR